jgi:hypothetical protein
LPKKLKYSKYGSGFHKHRLDDYGITNKIHNRKQGGQK